MRKKIYLSVFALLLSCMWASAELVTTPVVGTDYSFNLADGSIIPTTTDGKSNIDYGIFRVYVGPSNNFRWNDATHGVEFKIGNYIELDVAGSVTVKIGGCQYSAGVSTVTVSDKNGSYTDTRLSKTTGTCTKSVDFVYTGAATTLKIAFADGSTYVPNISVIAAKDGSLATTAAENVIYKFNLADGSIIPTTTDGKSAVAAGLFSLAVGSSNAYGYNATHGTILKTGNKITLQVAGNSYIKIGGCKYSDGTITVSSTTGNFDKTSQSAKTTNCFETDGSTVNFLYVGTAGTVVIDFTSTCYVPSIQIVPVPYKVELIPWIKKTGAIVINGVEINLTAGDNSAANATVTVGAGTVISATSEIASLRINMGGKSLSAVAITYSGNIAGVSVKDDSLKVTYADASTKPYNFTILVADNSKLVSAVAGMTYSYSFTDGSVLPQTSYNSLRYNTFISSDGILTMNSNTTTTAQQFGFHDTGHGAVLFLGNSMNFVVAGNATITFSTCQYGSTTDGVFEFTDGAGTVLGSTPSHNIGTGACGTNSFSYTGAAGVITATLKSTAKPLGEVYIHGVAIENAAQIVKTVKTDVWDFGAEQMGPTNYNNQLTVAIINSWYATTITAGSTTNTLPNFTAGVLSWVGGPTSDRLRTSNTSLTRYDNSGAGTIGDTTLTGLIYANSSANSSRYLSLTLSADDEVTLYTKSQNGAGKLNFVYMSDPIAQTDVTAVTSAGAIVKFVAKNTGTYHIYDSADKPSYFRVLRKDATYVTISGTLNLTEATGIPAGYSVVFTNQAGKSWSEAITSTSYSVTLPAGYTYSLSLADASGFIITNGSELTINNDATHEIAIKKVEMYAVSGSVTGLTTALLSKLSLTYTPSVPKIYVPEPEIIAAAATFSVKLEPNCEYSISASGVNDYNIPSNKITITGETTANIAFEPKPVYGVTINAPGLTAEQLAKLSVTFANLNETGYSYPFSSVSGITLRDGTYTIACKGLDEYPLQLGATSNLKVEGVAATKTLTFKPVTNWSFDDATITSGTTTYYKGMSFTGTAYTENKGHLVIKDAATVKVPMNPGEKVIVTYYYTANFSIEGSAAITTTSSSTSTFETTEYTYTGTVAGYVTINNISGSTFLTDVTVAKTLPYAASITVGTGKDYQTINEALAAVRAMVRPNKERVNIMIDPGNYEEMLIVDVANVSLINAAIAPSIAMANKGVDIDAAAVRVTSYYGHGYNYYSMGTNQKWNADALWVNKENGYTTYSNTGSGTTNGSYWNATVVVTAAGFEASDIIFENSYNQYISKKESEDVVVEWTSGGKGTRPTDINNTSVQNKSFVERAAAIAFSKSADKAVLNQCRVVGRQDSFYGAEGARVVAYKGVLMGGTDYIFGGMTLVCYKSDLAMNTSENSNDVSYITAAQQNSSRGFLMFECTVTSAQPVTETASTYLSKPGYMGRPWQATTSEVVFYNTTIETSNATGFEGKSLIEPAAWLNTLGGTSDKCYEYGTIEKSGENNAASRVSWSHVLSASTLTDGTAITTFNFTKGTDSWDPIPALITNDVQTGVSTPQSGSSVQVYAQGNRIFVSNVKSSTRINIYSSNGSLVESHEIIVDTDFPINNGLWIVNVVAPEGNKAVKVLIH